MLATTFLLLASVYAIIVSICIYKEMSWKDLVNEAFKSAVGTAQVMIILTGASVFAWLMTRFEVSVDNLYPLDLDGSARPAF